ncbi:hypothetical protein PVAND_005152 [Polypedilum vanderplanki]|uniref:EGF-like domain-containing protein n=1 Tax=Polypedilum vanderplanki TaxID=319348 RepID=A0A9J6C066_POLVA|nr:hypothetical protein PVAND_005152 [Polypedilum vanderplanki]
MIALMASVFDTIPAKCYPGYRFLNIKICTCVPMCESSMLLIAISALEKWLQVSKVFIYNTHSCENGICNFDNTCRCNVGYFPDSTGKTCHPKCDKICSNGFCSGPNRCSCKAGFVKDVNDSFRCVPTCSPPCENGICSGPNMCLCYSGYVKDRSGRGSNKCVKP